MSDIAAATLTDFSKPPVQSGRYQPVLLSVEGRLGRVRYFAYSSSVGFVFGVLALLLAFLLMSYGKEYIGFATVVYIPALLAMFVITKRRLNDLDASGWLAALTLIPLVNLGLTLWLMFGRGSEGANSYGPPPVPNSTRVKVLAWAVVLGPFVLACVATLVLTQMGFPIGRG